MPTSANATPIQSTLTVPAQRRFSKFASKPARNQQYTCATGLPTQRTTFLSEGVMEFWTEPQMASIHKMLNPRSIAIVGATPRMQYGGRFLAAALKAKDRVRVYGGEVLSERDGPAGGPRPGG